MATKRPKKTTLPPSSPPPATRGAPMLDAIFTATFEEIAAVGYGGLVVENVAVRAGVNKTTLYRRWPTKSALVQDALDALWTKAAPGIPDTGSLRGDLEAMVMEMLEKGPQPLGRAMLRLYLFDAATPELTALREQLSRHQRGRDSEIILDRAMARGELPPRTSYLVIQMLRGAAILHIVAKPGPPDKAVAREMVDTVLRGILPAAAPAPKAPSSRPVAKPRRRP